MIRSFWEGCVFNKRYYRPLFLDFFSPQVCFSVATKLIIIPPNFNRIVSKLLSALGYEKKSAFDGDYETEKNVTKATTVFTRVVTMFIIFEVTL